jgi:chaperonin GroES
MALSTIKPLGNRVLIRKTKAEKKKGSILLPDSSQDQPKEGEVLAVGPGKRGKNGEIRPLEVKVGSKVLFGAFAGTEVEVEGEEGICIMAEDEILAVIN